MESRAWSADNEMVGSFTAEVEVGRIRQKITRKLEK